MYGAQGPVGFNDIDLIHVRCIPEGNALLCKTIVDFVFNLVNGNNAVDGNPALNLKKKRVFNLKYGNSQHERVFFIKSKILIRY